MYLFKYTLKKKKIDTVENPEKLEMCLFKAVIWLSNINKLLLENIVATGFYWLFVMTTGCHNNGSIYDVTFFVEVVF